MSDIAASPQAPTGQDINLLKVLGPIHVWGLGVGIVLVGEFMGWNYGVGKGGAFGALIACFISGLLYTCVAMIDSEITSTVAAAGGQYAQAKHTIGPLMAFNVGLFMVLTYTMLNASDIQGRGPVGADRCAAIGTRHPLAALHSALSRGVDMAQLSRCLLRR